MAREVLSNGVINPDKYQADWYADLSNNWNLLNNLIGSAISGSEVDTKIATAIQELMVRTFQIVAELPQTGTEGVMYLVIIPDTSKYTAYVWENSAYRELGVIQMTITIDDELSTTSENPAQNKVITNALNGKANISHTHIASDITSGLATVATSGSYNDLSNKPTIPTVNNATLTIQQNGTNVQTFTANQATAATANIQCVDLTSAQTIGGDKDFTGTTGTRDVIPATTDTYDLGSATKEYNNAYAKTVVTGGITLDNKAIDTDANDNMTFNSHIVDTIDEQGEGYIRYSNGLQICWGLIYSFQLEPFNGHYGKLFSYPKSFLANTELSINFSQWREAGDLTQNVNIYESTVSYAGIETDKQWGVYYTVFGMWK